MNQYALNDVARIPSPALLFFLPLIRQNVAEMIRIAGGVERLRPHCKTHKTCDLIQLALGQGITKHKCATFAEAEMLAQCGVEDIFLAYNIVGPNIDRTLRFCQQYPEVELTVTGDHETPIRALAGALHSQELEVQMAIDINSGLHRTGVSGAEQATSLYALINELAGLRPGGIHLYDGQNHQTDLAERTAAVDAVWELGMSLADALTSQSITVPRIVAGGTGSFPVFADKQHPALELSPGTVVLHDAGYRDTYPDLDFSPAALVLTRVISCPGSNLITLDLGSKAVAADPPAGSRLFFPQLPDAVERLQNEEHLVLETDQAANFTPGDHLLAIPVHVCPTSALYQCAHVIEDGAWIGNWDIAARDRRLTI